MFWLGFTLGGLSGISVTLFLVWVVIQQLQLELERKNRNEKY